MTEEKQLWFEFLTDDGRCGLCLQAGWIMVLNSVPRHQLTRRYCICPNGRALKLSEAEIISRKCEFS